jgi:hypothetical protein
MRTTGDKQFTIKLYERAALGADSLVGTVQDQFVIPFKCRLIDARGIGLSQAGTSAKAAYLSTSTVGSGTDMVLTAHTAGVGGNALKVSLTSDSGANVKASHTFASTHYTSKIQRKSVGTGGNSYKINIISHSHTGGGVIITEDETNNMLTILFEEGVSARSDINTALGSATYWEVGSAGSATGGLTAAVDQIFDATCSGGTAIATATVSGSTLALAYKAAAATQGDLKTLIDALAGANDIIDWTSGTQGTTLTSGMAFTASYLSNGCAAAPGLTVFKNGTSVQTEALSITTAATQYQASLLNGGEVPCEKNDILTLGATTTSTNGEVSVISMELTFVY